MSSWSCTCTWEPRGPALGLGQSGGAGWGSGGCPCWQGALLLGRRGSKALGTTGCGVRTAAPLRFPLEADRSACRGDGGELGRGSSLGGLEKASTLLGPLFTPTCPPPVSSSTCWPLGSALAPVVCTCRGRVLVDGRSRKLFGCL